MSSKNKTETHSVQKREPYAPAKPNIDAGLSGALNWYNSDAGKYYYPDNTFAPSCGAGTLASEPPKLPTAVRLAATITTSSLIDSLLLKVK